MHVCDITRTEPAVTTVLVTRLGTEDGHTELARLDLGSSALAALEAGNFFALGQLVPRAHRPKNPAKSAAAKKGAGTRKARAAVAPAVVPAPAIHDGEVVKPNKPMSIHEAAAGLDRLLATPPPVSPVNGPEATAEEPF